ncbi:hypothetical protein KAX02_02210 [candidate division WOR-3 bacterium]|nr:hypothetical protein [candidate division WOR-3 bacterium]MCK4328635.1 hypothetical protein [candidate division WOR-3 bacterium]
MTKYGELLTNKDEWETSVFSVSLIEDGVFFKPIRTTDKYKYYLKDGDLLYRTPKEKLLGGGSRIQVNWTAMATQTYLLGYTRNDKKMICIDEDDGNYFCVHKEPSKHGVSKTDIAKCAGVPVDAIIIITRKEA